MSKISAYLDLFSYENYRVLLADIMELRKKVNSQYSYRKFGRDLGFSAPGYIKGVIDGKKNLGLTGVKKIICSLDLSEKESVYFDLLVNLNHCNSDVERIKIISKLQNVFSNKNKMLINDASSFYLTNRMCSLISILINMYGDKFQPDPIWIMRRLRVPTNPKEINQALHFMLKNNFIRKENGRFRNVVMNIESSDESKSQAIKKAHTNILLESIVALDFSLKDREFANVTVQMSYEHMGELKLKIKKFRDEIKNWVNNKSKNTPNYIGISINIQMYPFTTEMKE